MSLKMCCFASGSKGNCCFVSDGETDIVIDLGISAMRAEKCLAAVGANPDRVAVVLTHSHSDHIGGLRVFGKRHPGATVYCQRECAPAVMYHTGVIPVIQGRTFSIGKISVEAVKVPHDVPCFGYILRNGKGSVAVVTDVGAMRTDVLDGLCGCNIVLLEANHDIEMLKNNRQYSAQLKARIRSEQGHLSNSDCADACVYLAGHGVRNFILAHLSEENNQPDLAIAAVSEELACAGITDARIIAASQNKPTGLFEVC